MVLEPWATPVKPKKPATTETRKKMMASLIMWLPCSRSSR
jgi:hypothetical protein